MNRNISILFLLIFLLFSQEIWGKNYMNEQPSIEFDTLAKRNFCSSEEVKITVREKGQISNNFSFYNIILYPINGTPVTTFAFNGSFTLPTSLSNISFRIQIFSSDGQIASSVSSEIYSISKSAIFPQISIPENLSLPTNAISLCRGSNLTFVADSLKNFQYQWQRNGQDLFFANQRKLIVSDSGTYSLKYVTSGCFILRQSGIKVTFLSKLPVPQIINQSQSDKFCKGSTVSLNFQKPLSIYQIQWKKDGIDIANETKNELKIKQTGNYSLVILQGICRSESLPLPMTFGTISAQLKNQEVYEVCKNQPVLLALQSEVKDSLLLKLYHFQWLKDQQEVAGATANFLKTKQAGSYRLRVEQGNCIVFSKSVNIKQSAKVKSYLSSTYGVLNTCEGGQISLNFKLPYDAGVSEFASSDIVSTEWFVNGESSQKNKNIGAFVAQKSGKYWNKFSYKIDSLTVCEANSDTLTISIGGNKIAFAQSILRSDELENGCGKDTIALFVNATPQQLYQKSSIASYRWLKDGNEIAITSKPTYSTNKTGQFAAEITYQNGCSGTSNPIVLKNNKSIEVAISNPDANILCESTWGKLVSNVNFVGNLQFQWQKDGLDIPLATSNDLAINQGGAYQLKAQFGKCLGVSNAIKIDNVSLNLPNLFPDSLFICPNGGNLLFDLPENLSQSGVRLSYSRNGASFANPSTNSFIIDKVGLYRFSGTLGSCLAQTKAIVVSNKNILPVATVSGGASILPKDSASVSVSFTSSGPYRFQFSDDTSKVFVSEKPYFIRKVSPQENMLYSIYKVENTCGIGKANGSALIRVENFYKNERTAEGISLNLYPMPASSILNMTVNTNLEQPLHWSITDMYGREIQQEETKSATEYTQQISLENLPAGVYLFNLKIGEKQITKRIVKE